MNHPDVSVRCQRCGTPMDLTDPAPEDPWPPQQFWECPQCNRHFWTTYPAVKPPAAPKPKPAPAPAAKPATPAAPVEGGTTTSAAAEADKPAKPDKPAVAE